MDDGSSPLWALTVFTLFIIGNGIMYGFGAAIQKVSESEIEKGPWNKRIRNPSGFWM